jgi:hypothetical protein
MVPTDETMGPRPAKRPGAKALAILCLAASWTGAAHGAAPMGATSSTTVEIRLSVAPRMQLSRAASTGQGYCIRSNARDPGLPVYLIWSDIEPSTDVPAAKARPARPEARTELSWCGGEPAATGAALGGETPRLALIHPE